MPAPTNISALTAVDLGSLPNGAVQDVRDSGVNYTVWYKYTATVNDRVIGLFGFGALSPGYRPIVNVYDGPAASPTAYPLSMGGISALNVPIQVPVTPGETYFFEFVSSTGDTPVTAILTLTIYNSPNELTPAGSIFINDDTSDLPAIILDGLTGDVLNFINPFPAGEQGDILANGKFLVDDIFDLDLKLYNADLTLDTAIAFSWTGGDAIIRTCNAVNKFYVGDPTGGVVNTIDTDGNLGTPFGPVTSGFATFAASNDELILYYNQTIGGAIKRWDILGNVATTDLVAGIASHRVFDILVLSDDSIVVGYYKSSATRSLIIKIYDAAGTTLQTFTLGSTNDNGPRLAYAIDDPLSFWLWTHAGSLSVFTNILAADGSTITTFSITEYEGAAYQGAQTATPLNDFGPSFSCPFFILREEVEPPPELGSITVVKVTSPTGAAQSFEFTGTGGLYPDTFFLLDGEEQLFEGLEAGTYGIAETSVLNWDTTYVVSNGDPIDAIELAAGENVTVTFTNTVNNPSSGVYKITPGKRNDSLWDDDFASTVEVKIP